MNIEIREVQPDEDILGQLIAFSEAWAEEKSCNGYCANSREYIEANRVFLAELEGKPVGYLFGHEVISEKTSSVMPKDTRYFEIEEIYVTPELRSKGVGKRLFRFAEEVVKGEGMEYLMLSTATKNFRAILHFYIDELGMEFWYACLFKKI